MKQNKILYISIFIATLVFVGCSSSSGGDDDTPPPPTTGGDDDNPVISDPSAATLIFPEDNTECNTGIVDPTNNTLSTVTFEWNVAQNADSYTVTVTNLNTNNSAFTNAATNEADITIERGTPYSWFVTSRAQGTSNTADSAVFRFYNEGPGIQNYAPFPAQAISPARGATIDPATTIVLEWEASDIDDDVVSFEVLFGTDVANPQSLGQTDTNSLEVSINSNTVYYWQIITFDSADNSSFSEVFEFRVN